MKTRKSLCILLALVMSLSVMLPCFSAVAEETDGTTTPVVAPYPTQYPELSADLVSGTTTFTVAEIAAAADTIVSHYEAYKNLATEYSMAKAVTVAGKTITDQDWAYLAGYAINGLTGLWTASGLSGYTADTAVTYKKMSPANNDANNGVTITEATIAKIAEISWKNMSNYGNNNGRVSATCGSAYSGQVSYYSALLLEARALSYYAANGTMPETVAFDALNFKKADSDTYVEPPVITEAPATEAPATEDPNATPEPTLEPPAVVPTYADLSTDLVHGESTFTVAEIAAAAAAILEQYESYSAYYPEFSVAKSLAVGSSVVSDQDWFYMAAMAINGVTGAYAASGLSGYTADTAVTYTTVGAPNVDANTTITETEITIAKVAEITYKIASYITKNNGYLAASCGTALNGQVSYYSAVLLAARALSYYAVNGSFPETVAVDDIKYSATDTDMAPESIPVPTVAPTTEAPATEAPTPEPTVAAPEVTPAYPALSTDLVSGTSTFTVAQIAAAAAAILEQYDTYSTFAAEYSVAKAVTVGESVVSDQDWAYMAGYAINGLTGLYEASGLSGYTADTAVTYKTMRPADANSNNGYFESPTITMAKVAEIAWKNMSNYGNNYGRVSASCGSAVNGQVSYYSALLLEARALNYYAANGSFPETVEFTALNYSKEDTDLMIENAPVVTVAPATPEPTVAVPETTPAYPALSTDLVSGTSTFTVAQIAAAAAAILEQYESYSAYATEYSMAKAVAVGNSVVSDQAWFYMAGYAIAGVTGAWEASGLSGYTADTAVTYKAVGEPDADAKNGVADTSVTMAKVAEIAYKIANFANSNSGVAASCSSAIDGQVSYYSAVLLAARALNYYAANGSFPETVEFTALDHGKADTDLLPGTAPVETEAPTVAPTTAAPTVAPTTAAPTEQPTGATYQRKNILYAANSINRYLTNNPATFPNYSSIDGNNVYMPGVLELIAQVIVDTNNGSTADVIKEVISEKETSYEQLTAGSLTKAEYVALAQGVLDYIAENGMAPGMMTTTLGTLSFETILATLANVGATLRSTSALPESVEVAAWGKPLPVPPEVHATEFELKNVLNAARSTFNYVTSNNKYPNYTSIVAETGTEKVYMFETLGVYAQMIVNLNNGDTGVVARNDATFFETSYENITGTSLTKAEYVAAAQAVVDAINNSPISAAPGFVNTAAGALSYQTLLKVFASVGNTYRSTKALPESVEVTAWTGTTLPTPPAATATPEYTYLVFREILSGAVRVKNTTETLAAAPNYVTVGESRLYQGTALRMFANTVANISRGKAVDMPFMEVATPVRLAEETITACELTKAEYISLANRIAETIYKNNALPNYCTTTQGTMNHYSMIYMYARILDFYNTYGFLPDTIAVQPFNTYEF